MAKASSQVVRLHVVRGGRKGPPAWLLPQAEGDREHDVYTARSMKLLLRSPEATALRAGAQAIGAAVGVTGNELVIVTARWLGGASWRRIPLRVVRGVELHRRLSANRLHVMLDESEIVLMYWSKAARDFDRLFAALQRVVPGVPPPRVLIPQALIDAQRCA